MNGAGIIVMVAAAFEVPPKCLTGINRVQRFFRPRAIAMALVRDYLGYSTPQIGRLFGDRDHSTVMAALIRAADMVAEDPVIAAKVDRLRASLDLHHSPAPADAKQALQTAETLSRAFRASVMSAAQADPDTFLRGAKDLLASCERR